VIKTDSRSWDFPICVACSNWISQEEAANTSRNWLVVLAIFSVLAFVGGVALLTQGPAGVLGILLGLGCGAGAVLLCRSWQRQQKPMTSGLLQLAYFNPSFTVSGMEAYTRSISHTRGSAPSFKSPTQGRCSDKPSFSKPDISKLSCWQWAFRMGRALGS
jgi:hypothetical protein